MCSSRRSPRGRLLQTTLLGLVACGHGSVPSPMPAPAGPTAAAHAGGDTLVVFHAGSLTEALRRVAGQFERAHIGAVVRRESGGSVAMAMRAMDSTQTPDVLALADYAIIPQRLMPRHATWCAAFARNALVLAFTEHSRGAGEITAANWMDVLRRSDVRAAHSDPALDPGGYRAVLLFQLAELHYQRPGLADSLRLAVPTRTPAAPATLYDELQSGTLDYVITYRSSAGTQGLRTVSLPRAVDLSDPALADVYARAVIRVASRPGAPDSLSISGEPIVYGLTIPLAAPHPELARQFVNLLLSVEGREALAAAGFLPLDPPRFSGEPPSGIGAP